MGASANADRAGGPTDLSQSSLSQPKALIPSAKKFTFRKEPRETGLRAVGNPHASTEIKCAKKVVGRIAAPNWHSKDNKWGVGLMVKERASECCTWGWVFFKARFDTEAMAREWLLSNQTEIMNTFTFRDDDD